MMTTSKKAPIFRGINVVGVDDKGRMAMPSKYRKALSDCCGGELVVTVDKDACLLIYPAGGWKSIEKQLLDLPSMNKQVRLVQRMLVGHATECSMDKQGRLLLPQVLREVGGIKTRNAVLLGQGKRFELWDQEEWTKRRNVWMEETRNNTDGFTEVLEGVNL